MGLLEICCENQPSDCFEIVTFVTQQVITAAAQSKRVYGHSGAFGFGGFGQTWIQILVLGGITVIGPGIIRYVKENYVFLPGVGAIDRPVPIPKGARRGGKEFVEELFNKGWKLD